VRRACACVVLAATLAVALPASAQEPTRRTVEGTLCGGWGVTTQGAEGASKERRNDNGGLALAARLSFGSSYFMRPFFEVGWTPITASREVTRINGGPEKIDSSLSIWSFTAGPSVDLWRHRLRAGAGFSLLRAQVTSTMSDVTITPSEWGMAYAFYLSGFVYQREWFRTGLDVRFMTSAEIGISHLLFGVLLAGDALSW
jgi:hypothetical protein